MRPAGTLLNLLLICAVAVISGCAVNGNITDFNRVTTFVKSLHFEKPGTLTVLDGGAVRELKLKTIKSVRIQPDDTKIYNKQLFSRAVIAVENGTTIGSFDNSKNKAYVAVDAYLLGKANKSEYRIILSNVSKIEIVGR